MSKRYLYCRVSTADKGQDFARQHYIMEQQGVTFDKVFEEKISGTVKSNEREEFENMVDVLQPGDEIYFESLSRIGRSLIIIFDTIDYLVKEKKVKLVIIKEHIVVDPNEKMNATTTFMLNMFSCIAQLERDLISERISDKMQAMKKDGFKFGPPEKLQDEEIRNSFKIDYLQGTPYADMQKKYDVSKPTIISMAKKLNLPPRNNKNKK